MKRGFVERLKLETQKLLSVKRARDLSCVMNM